MGDTTNSHAIAWSGELLWPQDLPDGEVIDLSGVTAIGTWVYGWFRDHPGRGVTRATPSVRRQLLRAGVAVVWIDQQVPVISAGVSPAERELLMGDTASG